MGNENIGTVHALTAVAHRPARYRRLVRHFFAIHSSLFTKKARYRSIVRYRAFSDFQSTAWEQGTPKSHKPKRGQGLNPRTRAKAKGQSRLVPPGGFLRGEQFERERVVPPLSRLLCFLSCRSKKGRPRWQALAESRLENRLKGYNRMSITTSKYHPISKTYLRPPLAPSVTCGDSSLPEGAIRLCYFTLACAYEKVPAVNPSVTAKATGGSPAVPAPTGREPLGRASGAAFMYCGL